MCSTERPDRSRFCIRIDINFAQGDLIMGRRHIATGVLAVALGSGSVFADPVSILDTMPDDHEFGSSYEVLHPFHLSDDVQELAIPFTVPEGGGHITRIDTGLYFQDLYQPYPPALGIVPLGDQGPQVDPLSPPDPLVEDPRFQHVCSRPMYEADKMSQEGCAYPGREYPIFEVGEHIVLDVHIPVGPGDYVLWAGGAPAPMSWASNPYTISEDWWRWGYPDQEPFWPREWAPIGERGPGTSPGQAEPGGAYAVPAAQILFEPVAVSEPPVVWLFGFGVLLILTVRQVKPGLGDECTDRPATGGNASVSL